MKRITGCFFLFILISSSTLIAEHFENPLEDQNFVYSGKSLQKYMQKAAKTKSIRVRQAFEKAAEIDENRKMSYSSIFAALWLGKDLDHLNETLLDLLTQTFNTKPLQGWSPSDHQWHYHLYYAFGSKGNIGPGRMYPKVEKALLELLWKQMEYKNDIHWARESSWWLMGSENIDLVGKVSCLISSQIFMNEPEFKDRVYPDMGKGAGYRFWFQDRFEQEQDIGPQPRGNFKDGKAYTAADHYREWVSFFDDFYTERAKKGFFLEVASPHYMYYDLPYLTDVFDFCKDPTLNKKAEQFLDAVWADWAVDQINGVRGGAKTRVKNGNNWAGAMYKHAIFYFGSEGSAKDLYFTQLITGYTLKPIIWSIALDREGLGEFAFSSRKPGEEENTWPRPLGAERTMLGNTESRFVRYSYITPDYIIGCQMDHPAAVHSHLSPQARWLGVTLKGENGPRVYPTDVAVNTKGWTKEHALCRAVQHENVMLVQQSRRWFQINPEWFPTKIMIDNDYGIYIGDKHDRIIEKKGWVFVENGDAFVAVKVVLGNDKVPGLQSELVEDSYTWSEDKKMVLLKDKYSGMIFETSRRAHHKTLESFIDDILDNALILQKTVVAGFNVLRYKGCGDNSKEIYFNLANNEISMIGGERVNYAPEMLFDSPYIKSIYKSGIIEIIKGDQSLVLDFNQ